MIYVLGGSTKMFAVIGVTYPSGSTCTCTNGTKTLKAKGTSGTAIFNVPSTGTWTVTATNGDKTASKSVSITAEGQTENISVSYWNGELYTPGNTWGDVTGGWQIQTSGNATASFTEDCIKTGWSTYSDTQGRVITVNKIDITDWNELYIEKKDTSSQSVVSAIQNCSLGLYSDNVFSATSPKPAAYVFALNQTSATIDISTMTGEYYVAFAFSSRIYEVYNILLKK